MLFIEFRFFVFFLVVFCIHWALPSNTSRKVWLLLCSHTFYACFFIGNPGEFFTHLHAAFTSAIPSGQGVAWALLPDPSVTLNLVASKYVARALLPQGWWYPFVLMASTGMDFGVGLGIADARTEWKRRMWLMVSLVANLGVLCFFKYYNFFVGSAADFLHWIHLPAGEWTLKIFLPYGISFYTFQSMSYSIDVYRRRLEPVRKFLDLAFFISFFPQLVAGPIVRAMTFLPQVAVKRLWSDVDVRGAINQFFIGFVKKACVSEMVAPVVDEFFNAPWKYNSYSAWIAVVYYAVQIYCDFSGYTDMAIATARLLGYELTVNFDFPYFSRDVTEFWRRWHISLSTWLRDYLYVSLGGNRGSKAFTYRNLMLTMLLGGLWHGASWTFIIWGGLHGLALIVHREWQRRTADASQTFKRVMAWISIPMTFYWVCVTWIFFRAAPIYGYPEVGPKVLIRTSMGVAKLVLRSFVLFHTANSRSFGWNALALFAGLVLIHWLCYRRFMSVWWRRLPDWAYSALLGIGVALALLFMPTHYSPFIYFTF